MKRFTSALDIRAKHAQKEALSVSEVANAIAQAQSEIFAEQKGSDEVRQDPAVRLMTCILSSQMNIAQLNSNTAWYSELYTEVEEKNKDPLSHRRWRDADLSSGAVNVGAMARSIGRYAEELESAGESAATDDALRMIAHQVDSLFACPMADPQFIESCADQCASVVAALQARAVLAEEDASLQAAAKVSQPQP